MASLKNPAIAGDVQFDTFIYGAPPLAYPASLSQYAIYNTPDPAYAIPRPLASFPAVIWEGEEHSRWSWLG